MSYRMLAGVMLALCGGCAVDGADPATSETSEDLLGAAQDMPDCTPAARTFIDKTLRYGRAVAGSRAFEQCVTAGIMFGVDLWQWPDGTYASNDGYARCVGDPYYGDPYYARVTDEQIQHALITARNSNDVQMYCTGGVGNVSADVGPYEHTTPDVLSWNTDWLAAEAAATPDGARPFAEAAGAVWREAMHAHGYLHATPTECGYPPGTNLDYERTSMPYIVGDCVSAVLERSAAACGNFDSCPNGLRLVTSYDSKICECVNDATIASTRPANAFTHITSSLNTVGNITTLDNALLNGHPEAVVQFTHVFKPPGTNGGHLGNGLYAYYNNQLARWQLISPRGGIPWSTGFFIRVGRGIVQLAGGSNSNLLYGYMMRIDDPLADGNPSAVVQVSATPFAHGGTALNDHPLGVIFDQYSGHWAVFNQDHGTMFVGAGFSIAVEAEEHRDLHFTHVVTMANLAGSGTMLSSPYLDGNPNARFLVTADMTRGPVFDNSDYGVFYAGSHWYIYNERAGAMGNPMPVNAAFDVEVLRDEIVRFVKVPANWDGGVNTGIDLAPGDRVHIHGSQQIRTAPGNPPIGPAGDGWSYPNTYYPIPNAPVGSLIGYLPSEGGFRIGEDLVRLGPASVQRLYLSANVVPYGPSDGFFTAEVRVFR